MAIPQDPVMLLSYINTQLRDHDRSLEELCDRLDVEQGQICTRLESIGYRYDPAQNRFV